jgi:hypothetical protein
VRAGERSAIRTSARPFDSPPPADRASARRIIDPLGRASGFLPCGYGDPIDRVDPNGIIVIDLVRFDLEDVGIVSGRLAGKAACARLGRFVNRRTMGKRHGMVNVKDFARRLVVHDVRARIRRNSRIRTSRRTVGVRLAHATLAGFLLPNRLS